MNVYLIGFMGCGKNTLGKRLSTKLSLKTADTDEMVKERLGMDIPEIFSRLGEETFRQAESAVLRAIPNHRLVITGGGLPCHDENMKFMKERGFVVYLDLPFEMLFARLKEEQNKRKRPLIEHLDEEALSEYIRRTLEKRKPFYEQADWVFRPLQQTTETLIEKLKTIQP